MSKAIKSMLLGNRMLLQELAALEMVPSARSKVTQFIRSINPSSRMVSRQINTNAVAAAARNNKNSLPKQRTFSSSSNPDMDIAQDDANKARFVKFFAAMFMLTAGIRVAPNAAASTVDHTVKLLDAEEQMLVKAGLSRLNMLLGMDAVKRRAVDCGALPRLLGLIDTAVGNVVKAGDGGRRCSDDIGMIDMLNHLFL
jgi:hypothetical protein